MRTHGGAVKIESESSVRYSAESIYRNVVQKKQIAKAAYECLEDRDTIIIDDASTSFYLAQEIKNHSEKRIAVVTNSLISGNELAAPLATLYARSEADADEAERAIREAITISADKQEIPPLWYAVVTAEGVTMNPSIPKARN